ncbi:tyrosine-protein kinase BAZ1B-like isoform X2 [Mya arenaria]|uniref:tyrosine-protein kinase BAZ1B-like isoform X2 n=1 Tax=Mya arenaria TaxID=6604 RepID=UPI0022E083B3|nr:tyrosine-protein kinase BAZ1B-like isoform X2 [Mya arenaria]
MPLLSKRIFGCSKSVEDIKPEEKVYTIEHTKENFRSQQEYEKRLQLYNRRIWTCQSTGHVNLTHEEAWNSEKAVLKTLKEQFAPCYDKPVLALVHHCTKSLEVLVDEAWLMLQQVLVVDEKVLLKVKSGGKTMKAVVVRVDTNGYKGNPTSNCSSPSSDKENNDSNTSPKKWVPPKLLPYKYSIRFENEDSVIHSVPAEDLSRGDKPPSKELLRLFIRTYAVRAGQTSSSPWIVDDVQVKKFDLTSKFASFLLQSIKWRQDEIVKRIDDESKHRTSPSKNSPRIKTKLDAKEEKRKEIAKKSISKIEKKSERAKQLMEKSSASKNKKVITLNSSDEESSDEEDEVQANGSIVELSDGSDSDTPLAVVKTQLTPKKRSSSDEDTNKVKKSKTKNSDSVSLADIQKKMKKKRPKKELSLADIKKKIEKKKLKELKKGKDKNRKRKGQDPKQLTLLDMSAKKKGLKTPEKMSKSQSGTPTKHKSPFKDQKVSDARKKLMSPPKTPIVVQKLQLAMKKADRNLIGVYAAQAARILTNSQREKLPEKLKEAVMKKYERYQEKLLLSKMNEDEKKEYLAKRALERKKQAIVKIKEKLKESRKKFEDTDLELKPLPDPTLVSTPDGLPNEAFGDVAMVTEFISCYSGLLMPDDEYPIYTDALMKALTSGKDGFTYLSRTLTVLLQTLLQDQIAEEYEDLKVPLYDIPVNPATCTELVRLSLRRQDVRDDRSDSSDEAEDAGLEVADDLIQLLENQELYDLEPIQKIAILKGLCLRIMGTYAVQDYMEERQLESARLWRETHKIPKGEHSKKEGKKNVENKENSEEKEKTEQKNTAPANNTLLTQFYGKKEEGHNSGNNSEASMDVDEDDIISRVKRRRVTAAQAAEERRQKEILDNIRREREEEVFKRQKQKKMLSEGVIQAKIALRQVPVGIDRNHSRYWIFCDVTPGVFVEKGWVGDEITYSCRKEGEDEEEDSSSSEEEEEGDDVQEGAPANRQRKRTPKCVDTTFPHVGQNLWFTYDTKTVVSELIEALHPQGARESKLRRELQKREADITRAIHRQNRMNLTLRDCDGDKEMDELFQKELLDTELKLRNGGLGGVEDFETWRVCLETASDIQTMGKCLLEVQDHVLEKFRDGIMVVKKKRPEIEADVEEEAKVAPGLVRWREAVASAGTMSRLHVLLGILDSCIKWEKSAEHAKCKICRKKGEEDKLLLCDDCNQAFHMFCLRPALHGVPKGEWKCAGCAPSSRRRIDDDDHDERDKKEKRTEAKCIQHEDKCVECGGDESLILCAECPSAYHLECHDPPLHRPPRGRWVCHYCKNGITKKTRSSAGRGGGQRVQRKRYKEVSESEQESDNNSDTEEEYWEEAPPPPKKRARNSHESGGRAAVGQKKTSPRAEESRSRKRVSAPSPEIEYESRGKSSRRAPSELSLMEDIINKMMDYKQAWPFWEMVSKRDVPDYYNIIKQPISFQKIKDRLNCLVYGSPQEVLDAVALLFRNAVEYNRVGSEVYDCIEASEKYFVDLLKRDLPFYAYSRDSKSNGFNDHMSTDDGRRSRRSK